MIANQINANYMRKRGYSADSIAVNMGVTLRELAELERAAPVTETLAEPKHSFARCGGELA